jgi:hypothetical protein
MDPETSPDKTVAAMAASAEQFLAAQSWCSQVYSVTPVFGLEGVVGVFRCTLLPSQPDADMMVWVVTGDLPPAYLVHEPGDSWQDALTAYVAEMGHWVAAIQDGRTPGSDIIPVQAPPTRYHAEMLASRLEFLRTRLVDVDPDSVERDV